MKRLKVGDQAPNFDLTSTEGAVLMLRDEVPRSPVLLLFFGSAELRPEHLETLRSGAPDLIERRVKIFGVSPAPIERLQAAQQQQRLPFPLLRDDRDLARFYGVEQQGDDEPGNPTVVLVDRDQRIILIERSVDDLNGSLDRVREVVAKLPSSTVNYPRSVINRLIDRRVN